MLVVTPQLVSNVQPVSSGLANANRYTDKFLSDKVIRLTSNASENVKFLQYIQIAGTSNIKYTRKSYNYLVNKDYLQHEFLKNSVQRPNVYRIYFVYLKKWSIP
jgi:hypothetical protein